MHAFGTFLHPLVDLIIPPRRSERLVRGLSVARLQRLARNGTLPYHEPEVTALVWELKYYASRRAAMLGGTLIAEQLLGAASEEVGVPLLVPVPMHAARRKARGHNQTEVLCKAALKALNERDVSRKTLWPRRRLGPSPDEETRGLFLRESVGALDYSPQALKRTVDTPTQQGLARTKRLRNVHNSMRADPKVVAGRACIVVDDVATTGATLAECERALRAAGCRAVQLIALARS